MCKHANKGSARHRSAGALIEAATGKGPSEPMLGSIASSC